MPILADILNNIPLQATAGRMDIEILSVQQDSRAVQHGTLFVAIKGVHVDGHQYIDKAIEKGAVAILCEEMPSELKEGISYIQTANSAKALGIACSQWHGNPSRKMQVVAVTGTNGKTTTATLLYRLFGALGYQSGLLSTVENRIGEQVIPSTHTTPDAVQLNGLLAEMHKQGCTHVFMEASSHAIVQERMAGITLAGGVFTNITHDHLDYHGTFDNYIKAKKKLFDELPASAFALVNDDDKRGQVMVQNTKAAVKTFALKQMADYKGKVLHMTLQGMEMDVNGIPVWCKLTGAFNAYNLLSIYAVAHLLGESTENVLVQLSMLQPAAGRFECLTRPGGPVAVVDYAHTPDALENVLQTINELKQDKQVITVVGCGGNRDTAKRPLMAEIAAKYSDRVVLTSDNPRDEEPADILAQMLAGVDITRRKKTLTIADRKEAIRTAMMMAGEGDVVLVAGKGHENYQEIKGVKYPFDDKEIVNEILQNQG